MKELGEKETSRRDIEGTFLKFYTLRLGQGGDSGLIWSGGAFPFGCEGGEEGRGKGLIRFENCTRSGTWRFCALGGRGSRREHSSEADLPKRKGRFLREGVP